MTGHVRERKKQSLTYVKITILYVLFLKYHVEFNHLTHVLPFNTLICKCFVIFVPKSMCRSTTMEKGPFASLSPFFSSNFYGISSVRFFGRSEQFRGGQNGTNICHFLSYVCTYDRTSALAPLGFLLTNCLSISHSPWRHCKPDQALYHCTL